MPPAVHSAPTRRHPSAGRAGATVFLAEPRRHRVRRRLRRIRVPGRLSHAGGASRVVSPPRCGMVQGRDRRDHALVLEHGSRVGNGSSAALGVWMGVRGLQHLGQRHRSRLGQHELQDPSEVSGRYRGLCPVRKGSQVQGWRQGAGTQRMASLGVGALWPAPQPVKRGVRRKECRNAQVLDQGPCLVLSAAGRISVPRGFRERSRTSRRTPVFFARRTSPVVARPLGADEVQVQAPSRRDQCLVVARCSGREASSPDRRLGQVRPRQQ